MNPITFPIQTLFPKDTYRSACKENGALTPLYLISYNGNDQIVFKQYEVYKRDLHYADPRYGLTALAVAVMAKKHGIIGYLLKVGHVFHSPQDRAGFTPLHYACALKDSQSIQLLQEAAGVQIVLDIFKIFPGWKQFLNPQILVGDQIVTHLSSDSGEISPMNASQFQQLTGAYYYNGVVASDQQLSNLLAARLLQKPYPVSFASFLNDYAKAQLEMHGNEMPMVYIGSQGVLGSGIFARKNLPIGSLIGVYGGEINVSFNREKSSFSSHDYQFGIVDGKNLRNEMGMINDSLPNCVAIPAEFSDGREYTVYIVIKEIEKDTPLSIDYSIRHNIKTWFPHNELHKEELESHFQEFPPLETLNLLKNLNQLMPNIKDMETVMKVLGQIKRFQYLFHTPSSLYRLLIQGTLTLEQLMPLKDDLQFYQFVEANSPEFPTLQHHLTLFFIHAESLTKLFKEKTNETEQLKRALLLFLERFSFQSVSLLCTLLTNPHLPVTGRHNMDDFALLLEGIEFIYSLFTLSPNTTIDRKALQSAAQKIESFPESIFGIYPMFVNLAKDKAPHLVPHFQAAFKNPFLSLLDFRN